MGDEDDGALLDLRGVQNQVVHDFAGLCIEGAEGLVHQQDAGPAHQGAGNGDALLHAAGELIRIGLGHGRQAHAIQQGVGPARCDFDVRRSAFARMSGELPGELDVFRDRQPGIQAVVLKHHRAVDPGAQDRDAVGQDLSGAVGLEARNRAQQCRLAAAGSPDQGEEFALRHIEGYVFERSDQGWPGAERLPQPAAGDGVRHG